MIDYNVLIEKFKSIIKENGLKYTKQRELILKFLYEHNEHFTPEELNGKLKKIYPDENIGIATIYRTLTLLEDSGIVTSISFGTQGKKYEFGLKKHHDHLVCIKCGKIIEFYDETIEKKQLEIAKNFEFEMTDHTMKIIGICKSCQKKQ
ncbi:MAG: Fur family transcriptional regulator [Sulfurovaceae bacterium]|jgi:Fur family transcriptional regulator, ferric uptake regulator|nr:Fur family transcriptional regulator [Sulfurovaceae bacterium]MDD5548966.1 Fur family transcriptional regulator [Sulfurovaceae bacterium]